MDGSTGEAPFLCECGDSLCPEHVWLTPAEYDALPGESRLAVAPGHEPRRSALGQCPRCGGRRLGQGGGRG